MKEFVDFILRGLYSLANKTSGNDEIGHFCKLLKLGSLIGHALIRAYLAILVVRRERKRFATEARNVESHVFVHREFMPFPDGGGFRKGTW